MMMMMMMMMMMTTTTTIMMNTEAQEIREVCNADRSLLYLNIMSETMFKQVFKRGGISKL
jgi:hypothetical protein